MSQRSEIRDFLISRRSRITPEQAGLPVYGTNRRVSGLRREEVAMLAGVSADYYVKVERGGLTGVSPSVLDAIADALQLDEAERTHLTDLARAANQGGRGTRSVARGTVRPGVERILESITATPAYVRNGRFDVLALNPLGRALFAEALADGRTFNLARYLFLDDRSRTFFVEWETVARASVASLRVEAGAHPHDKTLTSLVGELVTRSEEFAEWWASHDVTLHLSATKTMSHSVAGEIELTGEALVLPVDDGLRLIAYTVEPGSESEQALAFLASWARQPAEPVSVNRTE